MSRFYGSINGSARTLATRRGTPQSGITGHIRGWNLGGEVSMYANDGSKAQTSDSVVMTLSGGSNGPSNLGISVAAFEEAPSRVWYVVRLPGGVEVRGYVGDPNLEMVKIVNGVEQRPAFEQIGWKDKE